MYQILSRKTLRYLSLSPVLFALLTLFRPFVPAHSFVTQLSLTPATIFGIVFICVVWFVYLTGYRYGRHILLIHGSFSLFLSVVIISAHFLHIHNPLNQFFVGSNQPFLLNLTYLFAACYIIQILYFWMPRTKLLVNSVLLMILFVSLLSIFGHAYTFIGIGQNSLLIPVPFGDLFSYLILSLVIFAHTNHVNQLYLNRRILLSFALMLVAVITANIVVYKNINSTVQTSDNLSASHQVLRNTFNAYIDLNNARSAMEAYEATGSTTYQRRYTQDEHDYQSAIATMERSSSDTTTEMRSSLNNFSQSGSQAFALMDQTMSAHKQSKPAAQATNNIDLNKSMDRALDVVSSSSVSYARQLSNLATLQINSERGVVLGVSITSSLSILLIIFTPLFIRQKVHELATTQGELQESYKLLSEEKSQVEAVLAGIGDGLLVVNAEGDITMFNQAAEEISGLKREAVLGRHYNETLRFSSASDQHATLDFLSKALRGTTRHISHNALLQRTNDQTIDVEVTASPFKDKNDTVIGAIVIFRDRSSEQALENAKDDFLSLASHQLRTPATATKQFLAMFLQGYAGTIDDKQRLFLQEAYDNNELGISIIEDLLNITRLESNRLRIVKEKIELGEFLRSHMSRHRITAKKNNQTLTLDAPDTHIYIESDPSLLEMTMDNLITNALKYSDSGDTVTVKLQASHEQVLISVTDEGIGIKQEDMPKLFRRFERLQDPQKQFVSGTGVGLYLVKKIIHKLHGKIEVHSEYGRGSTFILEFKPLR